MTIRNALEQLVQLIKLPSHSESLVVCPPAFHKRKTMSNETNCADSPFTKASTVSFTFRISWCSVKLLVDCTGKSSTRFSIAGNKYEMGAA